MMSTSFLFVLFCLLVADAALDMRGSWAAVAGSIQPIGAAVGPLTAGLVATRFSYVGA